MNARAKEHRFVIRKYEDSDLKLAAHEAVFFISTKRVPTIPSVLIYRRRDFTYTFTLWISGVNEFSLMEMDIFSDMLAYAAKFAYRNRKYWENRDDIL